MKILIKGARVRGMVNIQ